MISSILKRMSGEELLLLRILNGSSIQPAIENELWRRARPGSRRRCGEAYRAGRTFAARRSAGLAA